MADEEKEPVHLNRSRFEIYCEKFNINPNLFMLKVTLFMMYGATGSLLPFLTIHMQSIGLTVEEIAIVYLALPLTTFLSPPVTGFLVDKFGHYKPVVLFSLVLNLVFHHSLMLIPQMEIPGEVPAAYIMRDPSTEKVEVWWSPCPSRECPDEEQLSLVLHDCVDHCLRQPRKNISHDGVYQRSFPNIPPRPPIVCSNKNQPNCKPVPPHQNVDLMNFTVVPGKKKKNSTRKFQFGNGTRSDRAQFLLLNDSSPSLFGLDTTVPEATVSFQTINLPKQNETIQQAINILVTMHPDLGEAIENLGLSKLPDEDEDVTNFTQHFSKDLLVKAGVNFAALENEDLRCGGVVLSSNLTIDATYKTLKELAADCMVQKCMFRDGGPDVCPPDYKESAPHVFWLYFFLRFVGTTMLSASVTVMDPIALTMIQKYGGEFGRERLFSTLGMAVFSPLTGVLIDFKSRKLGYTDYSAAFYTYDTLLIISTISLLLMPIGAKVPADNIMRDLIRLFRLPHVIMFIFFLFLLGNCWGFIESYLFLYLKELGAPNYLLGITVTVGTLSSIPFLYGAERITKKIGHVNIIVIAFFAHAARLMGYSFIESAWWCFPFEAIEALSVHLMWVAAATYCAIIAPKTLLATLIGVLGMSHFSLGRGSGSFVGGLLIGTYGTREAFQIMGLLGTISGVVYGMLHFFWLHKYNETHTSKSIEEPSGKQRNRCINVSSVKPKKQQEHADRGVPKP
ncbi:uncharacterized protein LOC128988671 isoform X2 [Macrosteles quadrilineatus]|uniref:uncharacterized protein LOC128988671 isoform X2 n=1 Tax=Macrosteles quadrilineatus TaxID=74068 RepID=UPI0023E0BE69|nr:uncharacterized protein LOC128988671 isoform X2 [Macrosteles quadrilineatus]